MNEDLKQALASLREAEKANSEAAEAKKVIESKITGLRSQLDQEKKNWADADTAAKATQAKVSDATAVVASKMKPGVPLTENGGKTIFMVDSQGVLHELSVKGLNGGA